MFSRFFTFLFILCFFSVNVSAMNGGDPFAKNESLNIGKDTTWKIDKKALRATKSTGDDKGSYYHLQFDNKQLKLMISSDVNGSTPKKFNQLEIKQVTIDGKQAPLFKWCLNNQDKHNRFLQQGLKVKKNVCLTNGDTGAFIMRLNKDTLTALQKGSRLSILLKPFRTPVKLNYDISDFEDMYLVLNVKSKADVAAVAPAKKVAKKPKSAVVKSKKKCWAGPPAKYKSIKSVEYNCNDAADKKDAEAWVRKLVNKEKARQQKLAKANKQKKSAKKLKQAEAAAIAASKAKQAQIGDEITQKMLKVCDKYWSKGEHRCYCQKYIKHAPGSIQASSTCE